MFKNTIRNLTISFLAIVIIITTSISGLIYQSLVKNTESILKIEENKVIRKFGLDDPKSIKRMQFSGNSIREFKQQTLITLIILNLIIILIVGSLAYLLVRKNIHPIENSMKKQKEFISNVTHELKTPLTALKSSFEIELRSKNPNIKNTLESGIEDINKLNSLINGFLKLSLLENNQYQIKNETLYLKEVLDCVIKIHMNEIIEKRIEVIYDLKDEKIFTDKFLITELLSVLISNSVKFNKNYGKIIIKSFKEKNKDVILVEDNGQGIDKDRINKIFNKFYKEDESRNRTGSGIGLSIAKEIISILNARIEVRSQKNIDSQFKLIFSGLFKK